MNTNKKGIILSGLVYMLFVFFLLLVGSLLLVLWGRQSAINNMKEEANNIYDEGDSTIKDTTPPIITRLGTSPVTVPKNSTYTDAGATAADDVDGNITSLIQTVNGVNVAVVGTYTVTYSVSDKSGNAATPVTRTVNVIESVYSYAYNGSSYTFSVPATGTYKLEVWGAEGGNDGYSYGMGGKGGYAVGNTSLTSGQSVYVYVGGAGSSSTTQPGGYFQVNGGYNGGGHSYLTNGMAGGGGGATDMRIGGTGVGNRVIVGAGGGGGGYSSNNGTDSRGGAGGGTAGINGNPGSWYFGYGATSSSGGSYSGTYSCSGYYNTVGSLAQGGNGAGCGVGGGGGGGGYYGGGGAGIGGGGGGSSYTGSLTSAQTIAGNTSIPAPGGGNETGHAGNGYARITFVP